MIIYTSLVISKRTKYITNRMSDREKHPHLYNTGEVIYKYYPNGNIKSMEWNKSQIVCPTLIQWHDNGQLQKVEWFPGSNYHRINGPAVQWWYPSGNLKRELYAVSYNIGDIPADKQYYDKGWYDNGQVQYQIIQNKEGYRHCEDKPAYQQWDESGNLIKAVYWINGKQVN